MNPASVERRLKQINSLIDLLTKEARLLQDVCDHEWRLSFGRNRCRRCGKVKQNEGCDDQGQD